MAQTLAGVWYFSKRPERWFPAALMVLTQPEGRYSQVVSAVQAVDLLLVNCPAEITGVQVKVLTSPVLALFV